MTEFSNKSNLSTVFNSLGTSFYPVGMGRPGNLRNQGGYKTWKGSNINSNPTGIAAGHIRPLTNNDPGNVFDAPFGKARPIKHYRKGRVIPNVEIIMLDKSKENQFITSKHKLITEDEVALIQYNLNRSVKSSTGSSLGGGFGGSGLLNELQDKPGSYLVKQNTPDETTETNQINKDCKTCQGVGIVDTYYPNKDYLTENPEPNTQNSVLCCNQEKFALQRVIYASTNLKKNYYTTHKQYLQNRCKTYEQRAFNFQSYNPVVEKEIMNSPNPEITAALIKNAKPGSPLSITNTYFANCQPNGEIREASEINLITIFLDYLLSKNIVTQQEIDAFFKANNLTLIALYNFLKTLPPEMSKEALALFVEFVQNPYVGVPFSGPNNPIGCKLVVYKPSNPQYATEGAVESSTRILKLNVNTITKNAASFYKNPIYKNKAPPCERPPLNFYPTTFQNKKACNYVNKPEYFTPNSKNNTYRYLYSPGWGYLNPARPSNHYRQSPNSNALL
jgi:hypothetical protein